MLARLPGAPLALSWRSIMHARGALFLQVHMGVLLVVTWCTLHTDTLGARTGREATLQSNNHELSWSLGYVPYIWPPPSSYLRPTLGMLHLAYKEC